MAHERKRTARRWLYGPVAVAVLASTIAGVGPASLAGATSAVPGARVPVHPMLSAPLAHPAPATSSGVNAAQNSASTSPKVRQLTQDDTATTDVWQLADGARQVALHAAPVNYEPPGQATYSPIVTTLETDPTQPGRWRSTANSWTASFGPSGGAASPVQVSGTAVPIGFDPVGASTVTPTVSQSTATYAGLWPGVNATYQVTTTGVEEDLALTSADVQSTFDFDLTSGVTVQPGTTGGLDLVAGGQPVATVPPLVVRTAQGTVVGAATSGATETAVAGETGRPTGGVAVSVSPSWLAGLAGSAFPVTIDPSLTTSVRPDGAETTTLYGTTVQGRIEVGIEDNVTFRAVVEFNLSSYVDQSPPWGVSDASLELDAESGSTTTTTPTSVYLDESNYAPTFSTIESGTLLGQARGEQQTDVPLGGGRTSALTQLFAHESGNAYFGLVGTESRNETEKTYGTPVLLLSLVQAPPSTTTTTPANGSTIPTATPTVTATPVSTCKTATHLLCTAVVYEVEISTDATATGLVVNSGWSKPEGRTTPVTWTVPAGSLTDGTTYYVRTLTMLSSTSAESTVTPRPATSVNEFKVTLHLGSGGPSPTDTVGAAPGATTTPAAGAPSPGTSPASETVNLVTGDLSFSSTTHSLTTLGGSAGLSLSYNSLESTENGLEGQYFRTVNGEHDFSATDTLVTRRLDPQVNGQWTSSSPPTGGLTGQPFLIKWTGVVTVPSAGHWEFGVVSTGGMRVYEGTAATLVTNDWSGSDSPPAPTYGTTVTLGAEPTRSPSRRGAARRRPPTSCG